MKKKRLTALRDATDAKLRYAQLYLDAIKNPQIAGKDEEKAHQESFIFHLTGVVDAVLAEFNEQHELGVKEKHLSIENLKSAKFDSKKEAKEGKKLSKLIGKKSWLAEVYAFQLGKQIKVKKVKENPEVALLTDELAPNSVNPILDKFEEWQAKMRGAVSAVRESADLKSEKAKK